MNATIAPAIGIALLLTAMLHGRARTATDEHRRAQIVSLVAGAAVGVALVGSIEWLWWGAPFRGHWNYLVMELEAGRVPVSPSRCVRAR